MTSQNIVSRASTILRTILVSAAVFASASVLADPPDHAKAHGWRKKHDARYVGYQGREWDRDYGVLEGTCNRKEIATVVGAVVGGAIGSQVGDGSGRTVAIIVGSVLGAVVGREIGRDLDDADRACVGHALELAKAGQSVRWLNEKTGVNYLMAPLAAANSNDPCRSYQLTATLDGKSRSSKGQACRTGDGTWKVN
jgi:surface antigen